MGWLRNLVQTGDSIMVTIPSKIAKRWVKAGVVAVYWELDGDMLVAIPQTLVERHYRSTHIPLKEVANAGHNDKP